MGILKVFEKSGFIRWGFSRSLPYGIVLPVSIKNKLEDEKEFRKIFSFIYWISDKHIIAGLPYDSIIGSTIRRLLIALTICKNVNKLIIIKDLKKDEENGEFVEDLSVFYEIII